MSDRPRAPEPPDSKLRSRDSRDDRGPEETRVPPASEAGSEPLGEHGWWEAVAIAGAKLRESRSHDELQRRILVQLLSVTGLQRAAWIVGADVPSVGSIDEDECRSIRDSLLRDPGYHRHPVEWMDHLDANPTFPPPTWPRAPGSCVLLSLGEATTGEPPIAYADGALARRPRDANLRALELFASEARREWMRLAGVAERVTYREQIEAAEREILRRALDHESWNVSGAARRLDISRQHLHNLLRKHGLTRR